MNSREETITTRDYERLRRLIYDEAGIHLGTEKRTMLEVRIKRRLRDLSIGSYAKYCEYLFGRGFDDEIVPLIDVVTTNKTDFFREPRHFEFLNEHALPDLRKRMEGRPLRVWSAGCSTGEEPYTLAIVLSEYAADRQTNFRFRILASDISTVVLEKARMGVYTNEIIRPVPDALRRRYFMRSRDHASNRVRVVPELRSLLDCRRLNLIDNSYDLDGKFDVIFCRNVLIYFDRPTQKKILDKICSYLMPLGYLFVGHSEALHDMNLPLKPIAPALYRRLDVL
jgi:chemotaxis protein methyltransferase CheR